MAVKYQVDYNGASKFLTLEEIKENVINYEKQKENFRHHAGRSYISHFSNIKIYAHTDDSKKYIISLYGSIELNEDQKNLVTPELIEKYNLEIINDYYSIRCDKFLRGDLIFCEDKIIGNGSLKTREWLKMRLENLNRELNYSKKIDDLFEWQEESFFSTFCNMLSNIKFDCF